MKAAVIDSLGRGPRFADFAEPVVTGGETLVEVTAAGLHPIVRMLASGEHYGSHGTLPMIPGIDGTGRAPDGTRVYFGGVRAPWGPMAQRAAAGLVLPLPDGLDEVTAAAIVNPGVGAWLALTRRAALQPGETVLVLGATGVSGRIAVVLAARMGAGRVIAAGRNQAALERLGAAATVTLGGADDRAALAEAACPDGIHVIIDYLWASPPRRPSRPSPGGAWPIPRHGSAWSRSGRWPGPPFPCRLTSCAAPGWKSSAAARAPYPSPRSPARYQDSWPSPPAATCRLRSTRCPSPTSSQPGVAASAAGGSSSGPER